ncbi:hypothetical protein [Paenibacillus kandeliae]|uniref:hypothetical protein n=1 Tax=Paenibacillus kandeliae TaxID=3231269 RepID=UPI00345B06A2
MNIDLFKSVSIRGRVAYGICCFENVLLSLDYHSEDWKIVLRHLWRFMSEPLLDDCFSVMVELIPDNLTETPVYDEDFEQITNEEYLALYQLYQNIDEFITVLLRDIYYICAVHAYSSIVGYGKESLNSLQDLICHMNERNFPLPDYVRFLEFSLEEDDKWGKDFDGTKLSKIL